MTYRSDLDALEARHASLETETARQIAERDASHRLLEEARQHARLPILDNIRVAAPCSAKWADMPGTERVRHCGDCDKNVFNLSEMTRDEAEATIIEHQGKLCARFYQRADGTILTADCAVGVKRQRRRRFAAVGAAAMLAAAAIGWKVRPRLTADDLQLSDSRDAVMGGVSLPPPPPLQVTGEIAASSVPIQPPVHTMGVISIDHTKHGKK